MEEGLPMLLDKVGETFDAVMEPILARATIRKGRKIVIRLADKEIDMLCAKDEDTGMPKGDPLFRLYLQTKLPNPHYIPEIQAQTVSTYSQNGSVELSDFLEGSVFTTFVCHLMTDTREFHRDGERS